MITGLEFLKSWRFWIVLAASTIAITLVVAGTYILSAHCFPLVDGKPDRLYHAVLAFVVFLPVVGFAWLFSGGKGHIAHYPEDRRLLVVAGVAVPAAFVATIEYFAVTLFLLEPVLGANANQHFSFACAFFLGMGFGQDIAIKEQMKMIDLDGGAQEV